MSVVDADDDMLIELVDIEPAENRPEARFALSMRVVWDNGDKCCSGPAVNLSKSGIFVKTSEPAPLGKEIKLLPIINGKITELVLHGRVARVTDSQPSAGMGIQFAPRNRSERVRLETFVEAFRPKR